MDKRSIDEQTLPEQLQYLASIPLDRIPVELADAIVRRLERTGAEEPLAVARFGSAI
jgi:hypothetical protein